MSMYFIFSESISDAVNKDTDFKIDDKIDYFIGEIREYVDVVSKGSTDVLLSIDPYGNQVLSKEQVEKLKILGNSLLDKELIDHIKYLKLFKRYDIDEKEYIDFANNLINVCSKAIEENKRIVSLGD